MVNSFIYYAIFDWHIEKNYGYALYSVILIKASTTHERPSNRTHKTPLRVALSEFILNAYAMFNYRYFT